VAAAHASDRVQRSRAPSWSFSSVVRYLHWTDSRGTLPGTHVPSMGPGRANIGDDDRSDQLTVRHVEGTESRGSVPRVVRREWPYGAHAGSREHAATVFAHGDLLVARDAVARSDGEA